MDLVTDLYRLTDSFPSSEQFGLKSQMRRAGVSVPSNIAEGAARNSTKEFIRFLYISLGSLTEIDTQIQISENPGYLSQIEYFKKKIIYIKNILFKLIYVLKQR